MAFRTVKHGPISARSTFFGLALLAASAAAQPASTPATKSAPAKTEPSEPKPTPDSNNKTPATKGDPKALATKLSDFGDVVYLIVNDFSKITEPDRIVIPAKMLEEFLRKERDRLNRAKSEISLTSFDLKGNLAADHARLSASLSIRVDSPGGGSLDLQMGEAQCTHASFADGSLPLLGKQTGGGFSVTFDRPGVYSLKLDLHVPFESSSVERKFQLTLPEAPVKKVELTSSEKIVFAQDGRTDRRFTLSSDGKSLLAPLDKQDSFSLSWKVEAPNLSSDVSFMTVSGSINCRVSSSAVTSDYRMRLESGAELRELKFRLPADEKLTQLTVEKGAKSVPAQNQTTVENELAIVTVALAEPVTGVFQVHAITERTIRSKGSSTLALGSIHFERADTQTGQVVINVDADARARFQPSRTEQRQSISQLDVDLQRSQPNAVFRYFVQPSKLMLTVEKAEPVINGNSTTDIMLLIDRAEISTKFQFNVTGAPVDELRIRIPPNLTGLTWSPLERFISVSEPANPTAEGAEVVLKLAEPTLNEIEIQLRGVIPIVVNRPVSIGLPLPSSNYDLAGSARVRWGANLWPTLDSEQTKQLYRRSAPADENEPAWHFRHRRGPVELAFTTRRLAPILEADADIELTPIGADWLVKSTINFRAKHESMDHVAFHVPAGVSDLSVRGNKMAADRPTGSGVLVYQLANQTDQCEANIEYRIVVPENAAADLNIPLVLPRETTTLKTRVSVRSEPARFVFADGAWEHDKSAPINNGRIPFIYRGAKAPDSITLRFSPVDSMAGSIVARVAIEEYINNDGHRRGVKRYLIAKQRLSRVTIVTPEECLLREVLVDGQIVNVVPRDERQHRLTLPISTSKPIVVEIVYDAVDPSANRPLGLASLRTPEFLEPIAVQETRWWIETSQEWWLLPGKYTVSNELLWRFRGLIWPMTVSPATSAEAWFKGELSNVTWTTVYGLADVDQSAKRWGFSTGARSHQIELTRTRSFLWSLFFSGLAIIGALLARRLWIQFGWPTALGIPFVALLVWLAWPQEAPWIWAGAQWGVAAFFMGRWIDSRVNSRVRLTNQMSLVDRWTRWFRNRGGADKSPLQRGYSGKTPSRISQEKPSVR